MLHSKFSGGMLFVVLPAMALLPAAPSDAVTINYVNLNHLRQATHPNLPTITTLNPDLAEPSAGPILTTTPSGGFTSAMTGSVASGDWFGDEINTFNYTGSLTGVFFIDVYRAKAADGSGSAEFLVRYERGPGDPAANTLHWIQTVDTSLRGNNVPNNEGIPYVDVYASSYPAGAKLPFYFRPDETVLDANPYVGGANIRSSSYTIGANTFNYDLAFWDEPSRPIFNFWRGELFLASYDVAGKTVTVYDGILWGFDVVPEPSAMLIVFASGAALLLRRRADAPAA
jgi:hypothetical protein